MLPQFAAAARALLLVSWTGAAVLSASGVAAQPAPDAFVVGLEQVSSARVSRTETDFTYRIRVQNLGRSIVGATAFVTSGAPQTRILDNTVELGLVPAGATVTSADTFTLRQDRTRPFAATSLQWTIEGTLANTRPVANAGADQTVAVGTSVRLDGTGSTDADGDALTYRWSLVSKPAGSVAQPEPLDGGRPTFTVDRAGTYVFALIVRDRVDASAPDEVRISTLNSAPVANAGPDRTVPRGATVTLDGSASADPDGDALHFRWTILDAPPGSTAPLVGDNSALPSMALDRAGRWRFGLVVDDGRLTSGTDEVAIDTTNSAPVADAGTEGVARVGETVKLDGRGSSDPDGDGLTFSWSWQSRPENSAAALVGDRLPEPSFVPDLAGLYTAQLIVNDGFANGAPDTVSVTVAPPANAPPVAVDDAAVTTEGEPVVVDVLANDSDPDPGATLTVESFSQPAAGGSVARAGAGLRFTPAPGLDSLASFTYVVGDGQATASATVRVTVAARANRPPSAVADTAATDADVPVTIDVLANDSDPDPGTTLAIASFTQAAAGGTVTQVAGSLRYVPGPGFAGVATFTYAVTDGADTASAVVTITVRAPPPPPPPPNRAPRVLLDERRAGEVGVPLVLDASGSVDPDGDPLTFRWTIVDGGTPVATLDDAESSVATFRAETDGRWLVEVVVSDGRAAVRASVLVTVAAPGAEADDDVDNLSDAQEAALGTDPATWDSDGDGFGDGAESALGTDPRDADSRPGLRLVEGPGTVGERLADLPAYGPFAVDPATIGEDDALNGRITAVLNPDVAPADVNAALDAIGARLVTLRPGSPFVTIALPPRFYDALELQAFADALVWSNAFLSARPAFRLRPLIAPAEPASQAVLDLGFADQIRLPAMWNLRPDAAAGASTPVRVLVPDFFVPGRAAQNAVMRSQEIPCAVLNGAITCAQYTSNAGGNHGHAVVGAVAAEFDAARPTGAFPTAASDPQRRIDVLALPVDGYADTDAIVLIGDQLDTYPAGVVQTSLGFAGSSDVETRVLAALAWRRVVLTRGQSFVHVAAAGNDADKLALPAYRRDARLAAPWNLAASGGGVDALLAGAGPVAPEVRLRLAAVYAALVGGPVAGVGDALSNTVVVGSVQPDGVRAAFSQTPTDVTARGTGLTLACVQPSAPQLCNGVLWFLAKGTSFSAPQVAGVAAFLRLQQPSLGAPAVAALLKSSGSGAEQVLDAYRAVLRLDAGDPAGPMRRRLADVAGGVDPQGEASPDGLFDEQDLVEFLNRFAEYEALRDATTPPDRSRWDLNGDGYTGGDGGGAFDADADGALGVAMVTVEGKQEPFVESGLRDLDVLCALAYSSLYGGDPSERQGLLGGKCLSRTFAYTVASLGTSAALVRLVDVRTGGTTVLHQRSDLESGSRAGPPTWSPDGSGIVFDAPTLGATGLSLFRSRLGGGTDQITTSPLADLCPAHRSRTNTDGDFLYFFRNEVTRLGIYSLRDTGSIAVPLRLAGIPDVPTCTGFVTEQSVSVGGWWAYTVRGPGVSAQVRIRNLGTERSITDALPGVGGLGYWSPDGQTVAFIIGQTLYVARPFDNVPARVIATDAFPFRVSWAPDGRRFAFTCTADQSTCTYDVQTGERVVRTQGAVPVGTGPGGEPQFAGFNRDPAWSPDGRWIAYTRIWADRNEIWALDLTTGKTKLVTAPGPGVPVVGVAWRP